MPDRITRNEGARFWLPGLDELLKAAYYDPNRYDEGAPGGEEGYWPYPNSSEDAPWFGAPPPEGDGDWGGGDDDEVWEELTAGRYPHTVSPWGLLDVLGTAPEWTETAWGVQYDEEGEIIYVAGRTVIGTPGGFPGLLDQWTRDGEYQSSNAFRLATIVPAPGAMTAFGLLGLCAARRRRRAGAALAGLALSAGALAGGAGGAGGVGGVGGDHLRFTQAHGFTFSEIGDPGNPDFVYQPFPTLPKGRSGGVDYRYRIMTREVTNAEYLTFLTAFAPHIDATGVSPNSSEVSTRQIGFLGRDPDGVPTFLLPEVYTQQPAEMGWRFAARFANWMHHGAPTGPDVPASVFETGAYNASTFTQNPDGSRNDQEAHNPDARFWLPTQDEWNKAAYWDPNRHGEGEGGYWLYPNSNDEHMPVGRPEEGGQTNFGSGFNEMPDLPRDVGSYPDQLSPWGLLDVSGGEREWSDTLMSEFFRERHLAGTSYETVEISYMYGDELGWNVFQFATPTTPTGSIRLAMAIPGPGVFSGLALGGLLAARRRR